MPIPTEAGVRASVAALVAGRGYDLEDVRVDRAGRHSVVRIVVDGDGGVSLDAIAALSNEISAVLDAADPHSETPYTLEVTTPGVDRPLTLDRHWRRARGRRVRVRLGGETVEGRVGALADGAVELVVRARRGPEVRRIDLSEVAEAVVQVEFAAPDPRELELAGIRVGEPNESEESEEEEETEGITS